jgi:hypothetical protein
MKTDLKIMQITLLNKYQASHKILPLLKQNIYVLLFMKINPSRSKFDPDNIQ